MHARSFILACTGALLLAACGETGTYYEKAPHEVTAAVQSSYLPTHVLGGLVVGSRVTRPDDSTVVTALIAEDGSEVMRFVTTITPDGEGSRVATQVLPPEGTNKDRASKALESNSVARNMIERLAEEHVAASIEGRPFDMTFVTPPMAKGMMGAVPGLSQQMEKANAAASEFARMQQQSRFEDEYGEDWGRSSADAEDGWAE